MVPLLGEEDKIDGVVLALAAARALKSSSSIIWALSNIFNYHYSYDFTPEWLANTRSVTEISSDVENCPKLAPEMTNEKTKSLLAY